MTPASSEPQDSMDMLGWLRAVLNGDDNPPTRHLTNLYRRTAGKTTHIESIGYTPTKESQ